jgi:hypothetical protein
MAIRAVEHHRGSVFINTTFEGLGRVAAVDFPRNYKQA